ncbi:MAG: hypothetical protein KGL39_54180, partial [Patescibacteria group bacterium]|nr:hypothetical protein [Patescibacteria group bacterium]
MSTIDLLQQPKKPPKSDTIQPMSPPEKRPYFAYQGRQPDSATQNTRIPRTHYLAALLLPLFLIPSLTYAAPTTTPRNPLAIFFTTILNDISLGAQTIQEHLALLLTHPSAQTAAVTTATEPPTTQATTPATTTPATPTPTIITRTITQPVIEHIIQTSTTTYVTPTALTEALATLENSLITRFNLAAAPVPQQIAAGGSVVSYSPVIAPAVNHLTNVTVSGVSGLTAADIPHDIVASNYLPLTGGTLTGNLSLSGTLTAGSLAVSSISSGGAVAAPFFTATSTTATSSFAGAFTVNGRVGIGTTNPASTLQVNGTSALQDVGTGAFRLTGPATSERLEMGLNHNYGVYNLNSWIQAYTTFGAGSGARLLLNPYGGSVVVGSTTQRTAMLSINAPAGQPSLSIGSSTTSFIVDKNGNVGVGTTSPTAKLDVEGESMLFHGSYPAFTISGNNGNGSYGYISMKDSTTGNGIYLIRATSVGHDGLHIWANGTACSWCDIAVFYTNGNVRIGNPWNPGGIDYVNSSGNIGVGSTTPWARLGVKGAGTGTGKAFVVSDSGNNTKFVVQDNGNVGIGTTTPDTNFVIANSSFPTIKVWRTGFASGQIQLQAGSAGGTLSSLGTVDINSGGAYKATINNYNTFDANGRVSLGAAAGGAIQNDSSLYVRGRVNQYSLKLGDTSDNIKFAVETNGNVGIGTTTPWAQLSVNPNGITGPAFAIGSSTKTNFVVTNGGNVGINTTNPTQRLTVGGNILLNLYDAELQTLGGANIHLGAGSNLSILSTFDIKDSSHNFFHVD